MTNEYIIKQITIFVMSSYTQSTDGSWHHINEIVDYEKKKPMLTPRQRFMREKYLHKGAFFTQDFIHWYSTAIGLINSIKNKCKK